jgi:hypothetical protein
MIVATPTSQVMGIEAGVPATNIKHGRAGFDKFHNLFEALIESRVRTAVSIPVD